VVVRGPAVVAAVVAVVGGAAKIVHLRGSVSRVNHGGRNGFVR